MLVPITIFNAFGDGVWACPICKNAISIPTRNGKIDIPTIYHCHFCHSEIQLREEN